MSLADEEKNNLLDGEKINEDADEGFASSFKHHTASELNTVSMSFEDSAKDLENSNGQNTSQPDLDHPVMEEKNRKYIVSGSSNNIDRQKRDREPEWSLYDESNYGFQFDANLDGKWDSGDRMIHLKKRFEAYQREGIRRSVGAILICHRKGFPHMLLLQSASSPKYSIMIFKYKSWEKPRQVLQSKLERCIIQHSSGINKQWTSSAHQSMTTEGGNAEVGEYLGEWWRNEFEEDPLPYVSPHITRPKERIRIYQVQLPPKCTFCLPTHVKLTALPFFDLTQMNCGVALGGIPHTLSRFKLRFLCASSDKDVAAAARADAAANLNDNIMNDDDADALDEVLYDSTLISGFENNAGDKVADSIILEELPPELAEIAAEEQ